jgi:hypothetical protein
MQIKLRGRVVLLRDKIMETPYAELSDQELAKALGRGKGERASPCKVSEYGPCRASVQS